MSKNGKGFLDSLVYPLLIALLTPAVTALGSKLSTDSWTGWFRSISRRYWWIAGILICAWILAVAIRKRLREISNYDDGTAVSYTLLNGWVDIGSISYSGVQWKVRIPA
jgi:hypothetical protein